MSNYQDLRIVVEIIIKKKGGDDLSLGEQSILSKWLAKSKHNRDVYERIISGESRRWHQLNFANLDYHETFEGIKKKIAANRRSRFFLWSVSSAAVIFIALGCMLYFSDARRGIYILHTQECVAEESGPVLIMPDGHNIILSDDNSTEWKQHVRRDTNVVVTHQLAEEEVMTLRISVPRGSKEYKLMLDDGTMIWLNSGAFIEYPSVFHGNSREVYLSGEAFFDVEPDSDKPFIVNTQDGLSIIVCGTMFNVSAYPETINSCITLVSGTIEVCMSDQNISMAPNDQIIFNRITRDMNLRKIPDTNVYTVWTKGIFFCDETPLMEIFTAMERWYNIDIICETDNPLLFDKYTLRTSRRENYAAVLNALQQVSGVKYQIDGRIVYIIFPHSSK